MSKGPPEGTGGPCRCRQAGKSRGLLLANSLYVLPRAVIGASLAPLDARTYEAAGMTGFRQFSSQLEGAAGSLGAGMGRFAVNMIAPFVAPMPVSVFFFRFMRSTVTLSAVVFLTTPGLNVAAAAIVPLDDAGLIWQAAAVSTCVMAVVSALIGMKLVLALLCRRAKSGVDA